MTLTPLAARAVATPRPRPSVEPVTRAVLPLRDMIFLAPGSEPLAGKARRALLEEGISALDGVRRAGNLPDLVALEDDAACERAVHGVAHAGLAGRDREGGAAGDDGGDLEGAGHGFVDIDHLDDMAHPQGGLGVDR